MPSPDFSAEQAVKAQLEALRNSDSPWPNHGIQTMYEFGFDIGGMERSRYFGMSKDLYHFDHFLGQFQNSFPELFDMVDYSITDTKEAGGVHTVIAEVQTSKSKDKQPVRFRFELAQKDIGKKKGSLMTKQLLKES